MNSHNLVPDVQYRGYDDAEHELYRGTIDALERDDYRTAAGLKVEQAHRERSADGRLVVRYRALTEANARRPA